MSIYIASQGRERTRRFNNHKNDNSMPVNIFEEQYLPGKCVLTAIKKVADLEINYGKTRESMSEVSCTFKRMDLYKPIGPYFFILQLS